MNLKKKIQELKQYLSALYLAYRRKDIPIYSKILILIIIGYALSPVDLIPDFIPVLGYLDESGTPGKAGGLKFVNRSKRLLVFVI